MYYKLWIMNYRQRPPGYPAFATTAAEASTRHKSVMEKQKYRKAVHTHHGERLNWKSKEMQSLWGLSWCELPTLTWWSFWILRVISGYNCSQALCWYLWPILPPKTMQISKVCHADHGVCYCHGQSPESVVISTVDAASEGLVRLYSTWLCSCVCSTLLEAMWKPVIWAPADSIEQGSHFHSEYWWLQTQG